MIEKLLNKGGIFSRGSFLPSRITLHSFYCFLQFVNLLLQYNNFALTLPFIIKEISAVLFFFIPIWIFFSPIFPRISSLRFHSTTCSCFPVFRVTSWIRHFLFSAKLCLFFIFVSPTYQVQQPKTNNKQFNQDRPR